MRVRLAAEDRNPDVGAEPDRDADRRGEEQDDLERPAHHLRQLLRRPGCDAREQRQEDCAHQGREQLGHLREVRREPEPADLAIVGEKAEQGVVDPREEAGREGGDEEGQARHHRATRCVSVDAQVEQQVLAAEREQRRGLRQLGERECGSQRDQARVRRQCGHRRAAPENLPRDVGDR